MILHGMGGELSNNQGMQLLCKLRAQLHHHGYCKQSGKGTKGYEESLAHGQSHE